MAHIARGFRRAVSVVHESEVVARKRARDTGGVKVRVRCVVIRAARWGEGEDVRRGIRESRQSTRPHRDSNSIAGIAGQAISHSHVLNIDC